MELARWIALSHLVICAHSLRAEHLYACVLVLLGLTEVIEGQLSVAVWFGACTDCWNIDSSVCLNYYSGRLHERSSILLAFA